MKINVELFTGMRRVIEIDPAATKGAIVGTNLYWADGTLATEAELRAGGETPSTPGTTITSWSLILGIPANIVALSGLSGTGIVVRTGTTTFALREITSDDGSVTITEPDGVGGNIDLSVPPPPTGGGILPMVTGEIYATQPRFMYFDDGSLLSVQVE